MTADRPIRYMTRCRDCGEWLDHGGDRDHSRECLANSHEVGCVMHGLTSRSQTAQIALGARCGCSTAHLNGELERLRRLSTGRDSNA